MTDFEVTNCYAVISKYSKLKGDIYAPLVNKGLKFLKLHADNFSYIDIISLVLIYLVLMKLFRCKKKLKAYN